jgi:hypothetical protein
MIHIGETSKDPQPGRHSELQELDVLCPSPRRGPGTLGLASEPRCVVVFSNSVRSRVVRVPPFVVRPAY